MPSLFAELTRRRVFRAAMVYGVVAWAIIQVATTISELLALPQWAPRLVFYVLVVGFPVTIVVAWLFDVTPDGIARTGAAPAPRSPRSVMYLTAIAVIALIGIAGWKHFRPPMDTIAVLPFVDMSPQHDQQYLSDGITEEILDHLAKVPGLRVAARTSSFAFKDKNVPVKEIGRTLDVGAVIEGSVQRISNRLRITVQLINTANGYHIWSEKYDRDASDIFAVEDEIARTIADELRIRVAQANQEADHSTEDVVAHDLYLRGRFLAITASADALTKAIELYNQALQRDSTYALAYLGLAEAWMYRADGYMPPNEAYPQAKIAMLNALRFDDRLAFAHVLLGAMHDQYDHEFAAADREFRRAEQLDPKLPDLRMWHSVHLMITDQLEQSCAEADRAMQMDPMNPTGSLVKGWCLMSARRFNDVIAHADSTLRRDPDFYYWDSERAAALRALGRYEEAVQDYERWQKRLNNGPYFGLGVTYAKMGRRADALAIAAELEKVAQQRYIAPDMIALIYANLGDMDRAFEWLEKALQARSAGMLFMKHWPDYDPLRSDVRFADLLKRVNLSAS